MMEPIRILILSISLFTLATIIVNWDDIAEAHRKDIHPAHSSLSR